MEVSSTTSSCGQSAVKEPILPSTLDKLPAEAVIRKSYAVTGVDGDDSSSSGSSRSGVMLLCKSGSFGSACSLFSISREQGNIDRG